MSTKQPVSSARRPSAKVHRQLGRASARRRPVDYSSRRAGGEEENRRRSSNSYQSPTSGGYQPASSSYGASSNDRSPPVQRKRSVDYSSRRTGGDPENQRRRSSSYEPSYGGGGDSYGAAQQSSYGGGSDSRARPDPSVQRRRSVDYAARRAGGEEENRRRSGDVYASQSSRDPSPPQTSYGTGAASRNTPRVQRRKSQDYAARRAGGEEENRRRSQDSFASSSSSYGSASQDRNARSGITVEEPEYRRSEERYYYDDESSEEDAPASGYGSGGTKPKPSPQTLRRRSVDYSSRRSGGQEENQRRSRDYDSPSSYSQNGARYEEPERRASYDAQPPKRRSMDYSSRRGGGQEENRRRSGDQTFQPIGNAAAPADRAMPRASPQVQRRRSVDYAARRSGNQEENVRRSGDYRSPGTAPPRRSVDMTPEPPAAEGPPRGRRTVKPTPRRTDSSRKVSGREPSRRRTESDEESPQTSGSQPEAGAQEAEEPRRPSNDFFVALVRRLEPDADREAEAAAIEAAAAKRPSRDFVSGVIRRATRDVAKEENPVIESLMLDSFGRAPRVPSSLDIPDPLCAAAAPMRGMRPRNELLIDERKERARETRRYVFDFDYWANQRSTSRHLFNILSAPTSVIYRSVLVPTLFFTAIAYVTTLGLDIPDAFLPLPTWTYFFPVKTSPVPITLTASAFSLLLTFSTNNSAKRFNEARVMWGQLLQRSRDLGRQAITFFPAKAVDERATLLRWAMVFTLTLKCHLRPGQDLAEKASWLLTGAELRLLMTAEHRPLLCLQVMSHIIEAADTSHFEKMQMHANITEFEDILGGCERLLRTPIPVSYGRQATRFAVIWFAFFPILLQPTLGDSVVPATALICFALFGIQEIGLEIEEPFGILPLEVICAKTIRDLTSLMNNEEPMWDIATEIYDYPEECGIFRQQ